ncbi:MULTISPECIES: polyprenyl synthetase family protein [Micromonospora]|uniref:polyprenyl synthetase family protein n=1 Tax=Micromonospora TaxID=1873 RepID=UPI000B5AE92E|nr:MULTISPECIES: polyprenyl synthetase family protein [Micromonospora]MBQ0982183.1 polyprenyl synthetase family protein [Micromonospora sp. M61]WTE87179.1 polyprenyl synthetase family protein [Micromonospora zamorensis]WTI21939.1 polyprenyl synthetase family protein [Micromonospora zamorensis]
MTQAAPVSPVDRAGLRQRVDKALTEFLAGQRGRLAAVDDALAPVAEAIEAFVLGGGKRLRPAFAYWGFRGAGGVDGDQVVTALAALEFVQASALIHDDLMDRSDTRRGEPAVHRRFAARHRQSGWGGDPDGFGDAAALLLGDLCLVWSDELLHSSGLDLQALARARPVFDEMRTEVTVGQYLDVLTQATGDTSVERASKVARYKSAKYTVERPLLLGAALADATADVRTAYSAYGLPLGEAFQLRDDVLGVFGDPALTGKPAGDDLREGKRTFLVAAAGEATDDAGRELLFSRLGDPELDEQGVARLHELITASGALARTEQRIVTLTDAALAALTAVDLDTEARQALVDLAIAATRRAD